VALVDIVLTILARCASQTATTITADQVLAKSLMLARIRLTLVDLNLTVLTRISCIAFTFVRVLTVHTMTSDAGVAVALVNVDLTRWA
jgi:hypothetical protein